MEIINISGEIGWDVTPNMVRDQLAKAKGKPITIEINSPGGYVTDGIEIFNMIKNYKGEKTTKITGLAASMGSYIALAGDKVTAESNAIYMIHNASGVTWGDYREMQKMGSILEGITGILANKYVEKTKKEHEEIRRMMDEETWLFGDEIKEAGFCDMMMDCEEKEDKSAAITSAKLQLHACMKKIESERRPDIWEKAAAMIQGQAPAKENSISRATVEEEKKEDQEKVKQAQDLLLEQLKIIEREV